MRLELYLEGTDPYSQGWNDATSAMAFTDVVQVVRCKDCIHYENGFCYNPNTYDDGKTRGNTSPNWFCGDGERRENG